MGYYDNYLEHHGILGQKWGVRRFEDKNGHLTSAGKARYNTDAEGNYKKLESAKASTNSAKAALEKANKRAANSGSKRDYEAAKKAKGMYDLRKKQESDAKTRIEMNGKKITKHQQKLIEKFKKDGMSQEEAEVAAYKRAKFERTLAIAGAVTVAAAAAYGAKKYHDYVTDEVLEVGKTQMKRITTDSTYDLHDTFYAARGKDADKYVGLYGNQIKSQSLLGAPDVYQKTLDLKENMKIASDKNAKNAMSEVFKNASAESKKEYLDNINERFGDALNNPLMKLSKQGRMISKGANDIKNGKYDTKAAYDFFNFNMTGGNSNNEIYKNFKQNLKDKGYSGIKDRNDESYSGYDAKTARIIFDTAKVKVSDVRKVNTTEIAEKYQKEMGKLATKAKAKAYGKLALGTAAVVAANKASNASKRNKENQKAITEYKKEHPGTKLSNDEILENYYGGDKKK